MNNIINELFILADKSYDINEVPVGAVVIKDGTIIGRGYNSRHTNNDVTGHAEVNAIKEASKLLGDWRLNDCDLYVTLEPCHMCMEIIKESRINNVYYLLENSEKHCYKKTNVRILNVDDKITINYKKKLSEFFDKKLNR